MSVVTRVFHRFFEDQEADLSLPLLAGPLSLLFTLALAIPQGGNFDLLALVVAGLIFCARLKLSGLVYALFLLVLGSICKHLFFLDRHIWQLGIEGSIAIGFALTAVAFDWMQSKEKQLQATLELRDRRMQRLEEELAGEKKEAATEQLALTERFTAYQKELDEARAEVSAMQILNDVLRQTAKIPEAVSQADLRVVALLNEIEACKRQLIERESPQAETMKELNVMRVERDQAYLINETLTNMLAVAAERSKKEEGDPSTLYAQLRKQFDEKNEILHQTRRALFRADTLLQAKQLDEKLAGDSSLEHAFASVESELQALESENAELTELIAILSKIP